MNTIIQKGLIAMVFGLALTCSQSVYAQNNDDYEAKYLFKNVGDIKLSGFFAPTVSFSSIEGDFAVLPGGGAALLINQSFFVGGFGEGLATKHMRYDLSSVTGIEDPRISFGYGGFWFGYLHNSKDLLHFGLDAKVGWGQISIFDNFFEESYEDHVARDGVYVFLPEIMVEINLTTWFKLALSGGYRFTGGVDKSYSIDGISYDYFDSKDFSGPTGTVSLNFGWFRQ